MSSKVIKSRVAKSFPKSEQKAALLSAVASRGTVVPMPCSYCEEHNLGKDCLVADSESSRCLTCVRLNLSNCDVRGLSPDQLNKITLKHRRLEEELEAVEEEAQLLNAKILRLRKQKRMWYEKMMRAVRRGIDNVEELERVENEEAEAERKRIAEQSAEVVRGGSPGSGGMEAQESWLRAGGDVGVFDWSSVVPDGGDWSTFLDIPGVGGEGGDATVGGPSKF